MRGGWGEGGTACFMAVSGDVCNGGRREPRGLESWDLESGTKKSSFFRVGENGGLVGWLWKEEIV